MLLLIHLRPQLDRLRNMRRLDIVAAGQVRNGTGHFQNPVVAAGAESQFAEGVFHQRVARCIQFAEPFHLPVIHGSVTENTVPF